MSRARLFALATIAALAAVWLTRPPLPPDETRYLAVAWEMHDGGAWLVPTLNGEPYSHKPPLLFWLWRLAWLPFGPSLLAARLVQAGIGALVLLLTARLARALAPERAELPAAAALLVGGTLAFQAYAGFLSFDLLLTACVLGAWLGLARAVPPAGSPAPPRPRSGWALFALALGASLVAKGPAALLPILPPALAAPWWSGVRGGAARRALALAAATLAGCGIALAWALPAARAGGPAYGDAILWGQTAGRVADSFAHARPWWWYLPVIPALTLPWWLLPAAWRRGAPAAPRAAARFAAAAAIPALLAFSAVSGKQPHYLLPLLPAVAVPAAARLAARTGGAALARAALAAPLLALAGNLAFAAGWGARYDLRPAAELAAQAEREDRPFAFLGSNYYGQFHFLGRLRRPIANPDHPREIRAWLESHPDGLALLVVSGDDPPQWRDGAQAMLPFGTREACAWRAGDLAAVYPPR